MGGYITLGVTSVGGELADVTPTVVREGVPSSEGADEGETAAAVRLRAAS